jgi:hypothetical protein
MAELEKQATINESTVEIELIETLLKEMSRASCVGLGRKAILRAAHYAIELAKNEISLESELEREGK